MSAAGLLQPAPIPPPLGAPRRHLSVCASTNDEAARLGREGAPHGTLVTADAQTAGRGRLGRSWHSPAGENLYLSLLLRPPLTPAQAPQLTLWAGAAVAAVVRGYFDDGQDHVKVKWPNDVLWAPPTLIDEPPRKLAGILTELVCRGGAVDHVVVGIGVNINGTEFPPELAGRATSLRLALGGGAMVDGAAFLEALLRRLDADYRSFLRSMHGEQS